MSRNRPEWAIHPDGSFDLCWADRQLAKAFPRIDGVPIQPLAVTAGSTSIEYKLVSGTVILVLEVEGEVASIKLRLENMQVAPGSVEVLWSEFPSSLTHCFKQGRGMCGGSGIKQIQENKEIESFGLATLFAHTGAGITIWAEDCHRFEFRIHVFSLSGVSLPRTSAEFLIENVPLPDARLDLPAVKLKASQDPFAAMRTASSDIAKTMNARPIRPASYHWCSWYYLYHNLDMPILREYLESFSVMVPRPSLDYFQIDAGYFPSLGDWLEPSHRFPHGLKPAFEMIRASGYRPGIWIGPFMVGNRSQLAKAHPDWLLRNPDGNLLTPWRHYGEPKVWGYRDEESYVLDTSHPEAFEYLRLVFRTLHSWGAVMFKTDFMYWGLQDSRDVRRHTPGKTSIEYFRDVLAMIREEIGEETFWLGCIGPFFPFVGYADAMRVGGDIGVAWEGHFNPQSMLMESVGNQHFNQVFWQNDPDVLLIRNMHSDLRSEEVVALAQWQALMGGVVATSDPLHEISAERRALWEFVRPSRDCSVASLPLLPQPDKPFVAVRDLSSGDTVVLVLNVTDQRICERLSFAELGIQGSRFVFQRAGSTHIRIGEIQTLDVSLASHSSLLFHLSRSDTPPTGPMVS